MPKRKRTAAQNRSIATFKKMKSGLNRRQTSSVKRISKRTVLNLSESINKVTLAENVELFHNKSLYLGQLLATKQGTADDNTGTVGTVRKGDELLLRNINIRFWLSNKFDRPNVMYKGYLLWYEAGDTINDALVWFTQQNKMLDRINTEQVSILDSFIVRPGNNFAGPTEKEHSYLATLNKSWKAKKIKYDEGGIRPKWKDLMFVVVAYDAWGTVQTDNIASLAYNIKLTFKDP